MVAAFLAAALLHAAAIAAVVWWRTEPRVNPPGEQAVAIDLAPQLIDAPTDKMIETAQPAGAPNPSQPLADDAAVQVAPADAKPIEPDATPPPTTPDVVTPPDAVPAVEPDPVPPPQVQADAAVSPEAVSPPVAVLPPDVQPIGTTAVEAFSLPPATSMAAPPPLPPHPPTRSDRKPVAPKPLRSRPAPRTLKAQVRPGAGGRSRQDDARGASSREDNGGSAASADPNALSRYAAELAGALHARLRYPDGSNGGTVVLRFTVQRSGRVLAASLARSAGDPALDAAALATARPGTQLPAAPEGVPQQQLTVSVPFQFNRR